jgi:hypothetical protein
MKNETYVLWWILSIYCMVRDFPSRIIQQYTLLTLLQGIDYREETVNKGTKHDPLHDCYFQVEYLVKCMTHFRNLEKT